MINYLNKLLVGKSVLILGFGREGRSTFKFLRKNLPAIFPAIADSNEKLKKDELILNIESHKIFLGDDYQQKLNDFDVIIKSPGVKIKDGSIDNSIMLTSQTDLFIQFYRERIIGVSGTKGKSTTASLINYLLNSVGQESVLVGNIGVPAFDIIENLDDEAYIVFELSAHQLEILDVSPKYAILLNLFPEHLDYFESFEKYKSSKLNLIQYYLKGDIHIINENIGWQTDDVLTFGTNNKNVACFTEDGKFIVKTIDGGKMVFKPNLENLPGIHNLQNIAAILLLMSRIGFDLKSIIENISGFKSLPHRLQFVGEFSGVKFYNDSISTIPQSCIAALKTLPKTTALILGGYDRGIDYHDLSLFLKQSKVQYFILMGEAGERLMKLLRKEGVSSDKLIKTASLEEIFQFLSFNLKKGDICLLSPAAASYDRFKNFEHRGDNFCKLASDFKLISDGR